MTDGAPGETKLTTHTRDSAALAGQIAEWLSAKWGRPIEVSDVHAPTGSGMSSVTILFTADSPGHESRRLVARLAPDDDAYPVFPTYDLALQCSVMEAVATHTDVPVPEIVGLEPTGEVLGTSFVVMDAVEGRAPSDNPPYVFGGWLLEATPDERRTLQDTTVQALAGVHETPASTLPSLGRPDEALRRHFDEQRAYYEWTCSEEPRRIPVLERAFDWLEEHWPENPGEPVLCWGDARPGNILYDGFEPAAVLDWEMAAVAPREVDLAWPIFLHRFFQDIATVFELPGLPDFFRPDDVVATYEKQSGHTVTDLDWYVVYAALRHGVVMSRVKRRMIHFGEEERPEDPDDFVMHRAALEALMEGTYQWD